MGIRISPILTALRCAFPTRMASDSLRARWESHDIAYWFDGKRHARLTRGDRELLKAHPEMKAMFLKLLDHRRSKADIARLLERSTPAVSKGNMPRLHRLCESLSGRTRAHPLSQGEAFDYELVRDPMAHPPR
jgi:hypothetical protein